MLVSVFQVAENQLIKNKQMLVWHFYPDLLKNKQLVVFTFSENKQMVVLVSYDVDNEPNKNKQMVVSGNCKNKQMLVCP